LNKPFKESNEQVQIPALGLRNYWYPAIARWRLGKRPKAVTLLGQKIVLFCDGGKVDALADCAHTEVHHCRWASASIQAAAR